MKLQDNKDKALYAAVLTLLVLGCLLLLGQLRPLLVDLWNIVGAVLLPLVIAVIATYVLRPVVDALVRRQVPRTIAILLIYAVFSVALGLVVVNIVPLITQQITLFVKQLPGFVSLFDHFLDNMSFATRVLPNGVRLGLEKAVSSAEGALVGWFSATLLGVKSLLGGLISALIIPFFAFYLLKDYTLFTQLVVRLFPRASRDTVARILVGVDESLGRYVRGQLFVMLLVGIATFVGLLIVRMPNALLLSVFVALTNIIPYVGPFIGAAPALLMAFGVSTDMLIKVLLVNLVVQQLEGNVFSPWIMGRTMKLHPLLILLGVMLAGQVGGILGLIFAVPILAVVKVILEQVRAHR